MSTTIYLGLGSNIGEREQNLLRALELINESIGVVLKRSSLYETEPLEVTDQPWFLNCVAQVRTEWRPEHVLKNILRIEREMGRARDQAKGPRTIDIDLLLFGDEVVSAPSLTVPHPALHQRRFVLAPLAEIAPEAFHPVFMRSVHELLEALPARSGEVRKFAGPSQADKTAPPGNV